MGSMKRCRWIAGPGSKWFLAILLALVPTVATSRDAASAVGDASSGEPSNDDLNAGLRRHLERLTSREMEGRLNSTSGYRRAANYCVQFLSSVGMEPAWTEPGKKPAYFQPVREGKIDCVNVIARLDGSDPRLRNEYITLGAHLDHIGMTGLGEPYPGANDDASGCAAVLETARVLAARPPKRSILFVLFTAEEVGHLGSQHFVKAPPVPLDQILMNVNLEQIGSSHRDYPGIFAFGPPSQRDRFESAGRSEFGRWVLLEDIQNQLPAARESDTWSFLQARQPAVILSSGGFPEHHTSKDAVGLIDFDHLARATRVIIRYVRDLAQGDGPTALRRNAQPSGAANESLPVRPPTNPR